MCFVTRILLPLLLVLCAPPLAAAQPSASIQNSSTQSADLEVFVREGCPHCAKAEEFLAKLQHEQPALRIVIRDVSREPAALQRLQHIAAQHGEAVVRVPAFALGGQLVVGYTEKVTDQLVRDSLASAQAASRQNNAATGCEAAVSLSCGPDTPAPKAETFSVDFFGHTVSLEQVGLPLFTIAMGLLDGFNPCSMWVLILMISLLAPLNNRPRMLAIAGTFVAVEGIAYFLFMAAWLNLFLLIGLSRISEVVIAVIALLAGALNLKDFWRFGWGVSLSIPASAKPGIYARLRRILHAENMTGALIGAMVLAVLVQIVELLCTSGFPALFTRILTLRHLDSVSYYGYLLLYDAAYMLDDVLVLAIGVVTLSQHRLQENEGRWLKLMSGAVMVGLGIYLLLDAHWIL
ncbi:MAG: glutaredoxin domain-containing protein [Sideroxydans sp.]|nr:glutaredoxin domain-containing protein [Sideroxydans sp.]